MWDAKRSVFRRRQLEAKRRKVRNAVQYLEEGFDDDYDEEYGAERGADRARAMLVIHEGYGGLAVLCFRIAAFCLTRCRGRCAAEHSYWVVFDAGGSDSEGERDRERRLRQAKRGYDSSDEDEDAEEEGEAVCWQSRRLRFCCTVELTGWAGEEAVLRGLQQ
jgi:hypothetical protein